ncbi:MAG: 4Fe-4S binding protein [Spirochaetes bacterium]|nr:4Fe-4S binding protein [Spirochaetota bacterium]
MTARHLTAIRRTAQAASVILLLVIIWKTRYPLTGFISPEFYFTIDPLAMYVTSIAERVLLPGLIFATITVVLSFVAGRAFCGWFCPLGAFLDFVSFLRSLAMKPLRRKAREGEPLPLRHGKYALLAIILFLALAGIQVAWLLDPFTIFVRTVSFTLHPAVNAAVDGAMTRLLHVTDYPLWLESIYDGMRESFLSVTAPRFDHVGAILGVAGAIILLSLTKRRFWCRYLCPLGAILALPARCSLLVRVTDACRTNCGVCRNLCRMNAIRGDNSYLKGECIICLDCMEGCPGGKTDFAFRLDQRNIADNVPAVRDTAGTDDGGPSLTRGRFIILGLGSLLASLCASLASAPRAKRLRPGTAANLRPPGSLPEDEFIRRCIRCGNCMKVCPTNLLQPAPFSAGPGAAWAPRFDTDRGYCEYPCTLCGRVCPTGAIRELAVPEKQRLQIGLAVFDKKICIPYAEGKDCIVCEEHCPVPDKAIRLVETIVKGVRVKQPVVVPELCIGCAICEHKCPTEPDKGIYVMKVTALPDVRPRRVAVIPTP